MQYLLYHLQYHASPDKGHSSPFLTKDILYVKSLEKPFNKPNDTPNRKWGAVKRIAREHLISLTSNNIFKISV